MLSDYRREYTSAMKQHEGNSKELFSITNTIRAGNIEYNIEFDEPELHHRWKSRLVNYNNFRWNLITEAGMFYHVFNCM